MRVQFQGPIRSLNSVPYSRTFTAPGQRRSCRFASHPLNQVPYHSKKSRNSQKMRELLKNFIKPSKDFFIKAAEWDAKAGWNPRIQTRQMLQKMQMQIKTDLDMGLDPPIKKNATQMGTDPDSWITICKFFCRPQIRIGSVGTLRIPSFGSLSLKLLYVWRDFS